jgi:hypothetical protein
MRQAIHIGILGVNPGWEKVLDQIGVTWSRMSADLLSHSERYSCIVIAGNPDREAAGMLLDYLDSGGSVIDTFGELTNKNLVRRRLDTVYPEANHPDFGHIEKVQVFDRCLVIPGSDLFRGTVWLDPAPRRALAFIGLPLNRLQGMQPLNHTQFTSSNLPAIAERTALRSSGAYTEIILAVLKILHAKSGLPLVHKWWMPDSDKQLATFRMDTDYGSQRAIESAAAPAVEAGIPITWFLHAEVHEDRLTHFHQYPDHEIAIHCYRHSEFKTAQQYVSDITQAKRLLRVHGFRPRGYAAPYGFWGDELRDALSSLDFDYSSEFGYDYDSLPSVAAGSRTLQLPIHPVSAGSFSRFGFTGEMISEYFDELIRLRQMQHQPIHLYHHPNDGQEDVIRAVFKKLNRESTNWRTYSEWALFWKKRSADSFSPFYDSETNSVNISGLNSTPAAVHFGNNQFLLSDEQKIDLEPGRFSPYIEPGLPQLVSRRRNGIKLSPIRLKKDQIMTRLWRNRV